MMEGNNKLIAFIHSLQMISNSFRIKMKEIAETRSKISYFKYAFLTSSLLEGSATMTM